MNCQRKLLLLIADYDQEERAMLAKALQPVSAIIREVDCGEDTLSLLKTESFDCLITDYLLPDYDALALIEDIRKAHIQVPIVVLTHAGDEMQAINLMKAGAHDCVPKDKLTSDILIRSVTSAIRLQRSLLETSFYGTFYDTAPIGFYLTTLDDGRFIKANDRCVKMLGYRNLEQLQQDVKATDLYSAERRKELIDLLRIWGQVGHFDIEMTLKNGERRWFIVTAKLCEHVSCESCGGTQCIQGSIMDITDQKKLELKVNERKQAELVNLKHLRESIEMRLSASA